ncbi:MAG: ABC-type Na+ efflux pump permease component-like protein [Ilumatobacteraceae bacterium]|nr:ABC-type Na+ efflux pump permease component-like protein [Ilumatobacteraceae bacterium]
MNGLAMVRLVMSREIRQRVRSRGFKITTLLICAGVLGAGFLHRAISGHDEQTRYDVAIVGTPPDGFGAAVQAAAMALHIDVRLAPVASHDAAVAGVRDGTDDAAIEIDGATLIAEHAPPAELSAALDAGWRAAASRAAARAAGLDDAQIDAVLSPTGLTTSALVSGSSTDDVGRVVGSAAAILLFISINAFGGLVLTGVVEEKSTGVVEVLLAHVRAHQLLAGKVFGIGVVAMIQFGAAIITGVFALRISGTTVPNAVWIGLPTTILWFVVGFVLYSTLFALAGSFVSRQEDAQSAAAPISMVFTAAYITVFALGSSPYSTPARIVSVLPPFAPLLMPLRISTGAASVFEIVLSAVLLLAATAGMLRLAGEVYGRTLLHRGSRVRWKQALRMKSD